MGRPRKPKPPPAVTDRKQVEIGGVMIILYSIGYLAKALKRSSWCVRKWEQQEIIPPPVLKPDEWGRRWYTEDEIHVLQRCMEQENIRNGISFAKSNFTARVKVEMLTVKQKFAAMLQGDTSHASPSAQTSQN